MSPSRRRASFESDDADSFTERKGSGSAKRTRSRLVSLHRKSAIDPHLQDNEEQFILEWKLTYAQEVLHTFHSILDLEPSVTNSPFGIVC